MSVDSTLMAGRAAAEQRMTSACTIHRRGGKTRNADGTVADGWTAVLTDVPCRVANLGSVARSASRPETVGEVEVQVAVRMLHLPVDTAGLHNNDFVEVTAGAAAGCAFRIVEATPADQRTALRVQVLEVQRPGEWT